MPGQQKQYSRAPITHCSSVPAARARLSAGTASLLGAHRRRSVPAPPQGPAEQWRPRPTLAVPRGRGRAPIKEERPTPPPTYLLLSWPWAGTSQEHASSRTPPSNFPARGYSSASRFEPFKALQNMNCCCIPSESTKVDRSGVPAGSERQGD